MDDEERPVHLIIDVSTGAETYVPVTDAEWDQMRQRQADAATEEARKATEAASLAQQAAEHPDPLVRALADRAGLS